MNHVRFAQVLARRLSTALLIVGLLVVAMRPATAQQAPPCTASPSSQSITISSPISIAPGASNGLIGSPSSPATVSVDCWSAFNATPNYYDDFTVLAGQLAALDSVNPSPSGKGLMFQTNLPGIDVLLTATPVQPSSGNNGPNGTPGWAIKTIKCNSNGNGSCRPNPISATFTAQLVKVGPVSPGTINSIQLLQLFDSDSVPPDPFGNPTTNYPQASPAYGTLTLNPVTIAMSACNVTAGSTNLTVTLPPIDTNALPTTGAVAGQTAFNIQYTCPAGWSLYMTMNTATPGSATGVILPPASCPQGTPASNVGVQLLQNNLQPVPFNTAQPLGNSPNGTLTLTYYAQYYATGSPIGAGPVCGTATFTMSYQ